MVFRLVYSGVVHYGSVWLHLAYFYASKQAPCMNGRCVAQGLNKWVVQFILINKYVAVPIFIFFLVSCGVRKSFVFQYIVKSDSIQFLLFPCNIVGESTASFQLGQAITSPFIKYF